MKMKKNLRNAFIAVLAMVGVSANAQTLVTFTAGTDKGKQTMVASDPDMMTKSDVTIKSNKAAFATAEYRFAKRSTTNFSCTTGNITKIVITESAKASKKKIKIRLLVLILRMVGLLTEMLKLQLGQEKQIALKLLQQTTKCMLIKL